MTEKTLLMDLMEDLQDQGNTEEQKSYMIRIMIHGCQSGMVGHLISYHDTNNYYKEHKEEINELLYDLMADTGLSIGELFGDKWDKEDPLALEQFNRNLLAWFGYEETVRKHYTELHGDF